MKNKGKNKQTELSINYFTKTDTLKIVGATILILGLASLAIGIGIVGYILAIIGTPTGVVLFLIGSSSKASDDDMEADLNRKLIDLKIDIDNDRKYHLKLLKNQKDITIEGYHFDDGVMIKKLKSGSLRTNLYTRTKLRILSDRLYIVSKQISLITDDHSYNQYEIMLDDIIGASISRFENQIEFNKNTFLVKPCFLVIETTASSYSFPIIDAVTSDELAETIMRHSNKYKENN